MTVPQQPVKWRKAQASQDEGACVELAHTGEAIRDSKNPDGPQLRVSLAGLLAAVKTDQIIR